ELYIYNYTQNAQYESVWNEVTLVCRGLIMDSNNHILARPFPKFFNLGEQPDQPIPDEPFEIFEKLDGSLGILYWIEKKPYLASRGSFTSEQAKKGNQLLTYKYAEALEYLNPAYTYLFEIIYPENRIVVNYGSQESLVLLAIIETATAKELPLVNIGFPIAHKYDGIKDIHLLRTMETHNKEGFVIKFKGGLRYKIKFAEYIRIHKIVTQVSNITVWEYLKDGKSLEYLLERVPDEFYVWVRTTREALLESYSYIERRARAQYKVLGSRKETAEYFMTCDYPAVLFRLLDGRTYDDIIWKLLKPKFSKPFSNVEE
ncbi:MAG TPA: T4 RnlA family RNA ligase, partial [Cytophagales bacterium]|nr:T4 RnlA family RNA ligase [Cytophagales bacterium]